MAKEGGTDCTRDSCSLAKVGSNNGDNQSSPDSLRTFLPLIADKVESYHCYWSYEKFLVIANLACGQDESSLMTKANHLANLWS